MIDCIVLEEDGAVLLDYKTDAISGRFPGGFDQAKRVLEKDIRCKFIYMDRLSNKSGRRK